MRPIGTKSITAMSFFVLLIGLALHLEFFDRNSFERISSMTGFCIGAFTILVGTWNYQFLGWGVQSRFYVRGTRTTRWQGESPIFEIGKSAIVMGPVEMTPPREFPRFLLLLFSYGSCFCISLFSFNRHSVMVMMETPRKIFQAGSKFCPKESDEKPTDQIPAKPGCDLVQRAFALGYLKNLGDCATDQQKAKSEICLLRQWDEPYLHYSYRLLKDKVMQAQLSVKVLKEEQLKLKRQLEHLKPLIGKVGQVVNNAPKASHHIFTNLPYPSGEFAYLWREIFDPNYCLYRYKNLPHRLAKTDNSGTILSQTFEHVYAQMLFNQKYEAGLSQCQDFKIHWNSPEDSCEQLSQNADTFLNKIGIKRHVSSVLTRLEERELLNSLEQANKREENQMVKAEHENLSVAPPKPKTTISAQTVISFQCLMQIDQLAGQSLSSQELPVKFSHHSFVARKMIFQSPTKIQSVDVDMYKYLSNALADGFSYQKYLSHQYSSNQQSLDLDPETLRPGSLILSRLENLKTADIFVGNDWLQSRQDLLEVYPYYFHLYHFVQIFRTSYRTQRTHL